MTPHTSPGPGVTRPRLGGAVRCAPMRATAFRVLGLIGFGLGPTILFTGCGEQETGARTTLNSIQPSSYVVRPPVTTTTTIPGDDGIDDDGRTDRPQEYTIQPGDFPLRIANLFGVTLEELSNFNGWTPPNYSEFPLPGVTIGIPPGGLVPGAVPPADGGTAGGGGDTGGETAAPVTTLPGAEGECVPGEHVIVAGDIPIRVANQYDITLEQLQAANVGNPAMTQFIPGQTLRIPCD